MLNCVFSLEAGITVGIVTWIWTRDPEFDSRQRKYFLNKRLGSCPIYHCEYLIIINLHCLFEKCAFIYTFRRQNRLTGASESIYGSFTGTAAGWTAAYIF